MHSTLKRENVILSLIKFFTDSITSAPVIYDKWFDVIEQDEWYSVNLGDIDWGNMSSMPLTIICCKRGTFENYDLANFVDKMMVILIPDGDKKLSVDLYDTTVTPWIKMGGFSFILKKQETDDVLSDGTKYVLIDILVKWGTML